MRWIVLVILCAGLAACESSRTSDRSTDSERRPRVNRQSERVDGMERISSGARAEALSEARAGASARPLGLPGEISAAPNHPRLILTDADLQRLKTRIDRDPLARQWFASLRGKADALVNQAPAQKPSGSLLRTSREQMLHITTLAGIYRLNHDDRLARQAIAEMLSVCRFTNWEPNDFLATAEMTAAVGIGYDWLYSAMSPDERSAIREGLVRNGLRAGLRAYDSNDGWTGATHNWNLVCNGGLIVGALAVVDEEPEVAQRVLSEAQRSIHSGISAFAPDGGWEEGPSYWTYATRYTALSLSALRSTLDTDWGLSRAPGVAETGLFRIYACGPTDQAFNFADSSPALGNSAAMEWLAGTFDRPVYASFEQQEIGKDLGILDLLWYAPAEKNLVEKLPLDARFRGVDLVSMRSAWNDPQATWIAVKGGSNEAHHGHLDQGTFVLDSLGQRWAIDLGSDNYDLPDYFGSKRWSYYRCGTRGHNTITIDNHNQDSRTDAPITSFVSRRDGCRTIIDMSRGYHDDAKRVLRGVAMLDRRQVLIQDEIDLDGDDKDVRWNMHTNARIDIDGPVAHLRQGDKTMTARILSPVGAKFDSIEVNLLRPQEPTPNTRKLYIRVANERKRVVFAVLFTPGDESSNPARPARITPLSQWPVK